MEPPPRKKRLFRRAENGIVACPCSSLVGKALQMEYWGYREHIGEHTDHHILELLILRQSGRKRGVQGRESLERAQPVYLVVRCLRKADSGCQRETELVVVVGLAAPR
jgi:hypothetical protein